MFFLAPGLLSGFKYHPHFVSLKVPVRADLLVAATFWNPLGPFGQFPLIKLRFFFPAGMVLSRFLAGLNDTSLSVSPSSSLAVLYSSLSDEKLGSKHFSPLLLPLEVLATTLLIIGLLERNPCNLDGCGGSFTRRPGGIDLPAPLMDGVPLPGVEPLPLVPRLGVALLGDLPLTQPALPLPGEELPGLLVLLPGELPDQSLGKLIYTAYKFAASSNSESPSNKLPCEWVTGEPNLANGFPPGDLPGGCPVTFLAVCLVLAIDWEEEFTNLVCVRYDSNNYHSFSLSESEHIIPNKSYCCSSTVKQQQLNPERVSSLKHDLLSATAILSTIQPNTTRN